MFKYLTERLKILLKLPFYLIYEVILNAKAQNWNRPNHIGIILDGNRRWAKKTKASSIIDGHSKGADKLDEVLDWCFDYNIKL